MKAIEENGRLSPTKFNQVQEDIRKVELLNHNKTVKALEKKNREQEKNHARMITMMDRWERVVDSQANRLKNQKFEKGEQEKQFQQEMGLKEIEVKELKELRDIGIETAEKVKIEHDAVVQKLEEDNKQEMELKETEVKELMELMEKEAKEQKDVVDKLDRQHSQELKEMGVKQVKELKELLDIGIETAERVKVKHDGKVLKLEEDIKVLKSQIEEHSKVDSKET